MKMNNFCFSSPPLVSASTECHDTSEPYEECDRIQPLDIAENDLNQIENVGAERGHSPARRIDNCNVNRDNYSHLFELLIISIFFYTGY